MPTLPFNTDEQFVVDVQGPLPNAAIASAMSLLAEAHLLANDAACDSWDFAVEISELERLGISRGGVRWMLSRKLVRHLYETTAAQGERRTFAVAASAARFTGSSCLVITDAGLKLLSWDDRRPESVGREESTFLPSIPLPTIQQARARPRGSVVLPHFDAARCELLVGGQIIKRFRCPAPNQVTVLSAFEELSWPARLDDPLPQAGEVCAKRRLLQTIKALNAHHIHKLLRFAGDGSGEGVLWELPGCR